MQFKFYLSLIVAKMLYYFLRITKLSSGTAIIGLIALKICPDFLRYADQYIIDSKINITGTNGKTTTSGILSHLINNDKKSLITNSIGANMLNGIVNALALQINFNKKFQYSVIETDEAFLSKIYEKMGGDYLLVTNLFEDQVDRFATPFITRDFIQKAINLNKDVQLILNADEPISASLESSKEPIFYSFNSVSYEQNCVMEDSSTEIICPKCADNLCYNKKYYSHVGHFECKCGYKTSRAKYCADVVLYNTHSVIKINDEIFDIPLTGLYNAYNALGAIALAKELKIENIQDNIKSFKVAFGRNEKRNLLGHDTIIQLIKNPAGTNEVLKTVDLDSNILIAMNNNTADGTDISWINKVNFETLAKSENEIVLTGLCAKEIADRLQVAGVKKFKIISEINDAVEYIGKNADNNITILSTYTALLKIDKIKEMKKCY